MNKKMIEEIARAAEARTQRKPGTVTAEDVMRVMEGHGLESHPVDAAIKAEIERIFQ